MSPTILRGEIYGRRFCTYCGNDTAEHFEYEDEDGKHLHCRCSYCGEDSYASSNDTKESIRTRLKDRHWVDVKEPIQLIRPYYSIRRI